MLMFSVFLGYSDFLWLQERLEDVFPGVIIPPLPPKNSLGRFDDAFIESRRMLLERFINRIVNHLKLRKSTFVEIFLRAPEGAFHATRNQTSVHIITKATHWIGTTISNNTVHHVCLNILYN
jgi:hypothetical protein